jgi:retinol dehydrogenase-12
MVGKVVVITGATSGIGKETAVELAGRGATVVLAARNEAKGQATLDEVRTRSGSQAVSVGALDLADLESVRRFADRLLADHARLDVLVNNAGAIFPGRLETADGFESTFGVNHVGHFLLTTQLLDRLRASAPAHVITLSSFAHRLVRGLTWDDLQSERRYISMEAYGRSKLANILFTTELSQRLAGTGVTANAVHPGAVRSNFGAEYYAGPIGRMISAGSGLVMITPRAGARTTVFLASDPAVAEETGGYWVRQRRHKPSRAARDPRAAQRLWIASEELVDRAARRSEAS